MKKYISTALALAMVGAMAASASAAEVTIGGDMRVRGIDQADYRNDNASYDQRVRLTVKAAAAGGASVNLRFRTDGNNGMWNGGANTGAADNGMYTDYAYITVPVGSVTINAGRQMDAWGHRLDAFEDAVDRLAFSTKMGDVDVTAYADKTAEDTVNNDDDDAYGVVLETKVAGADVALELVRDIDDAADTEDSTIGLMVNTDVAGVAVNSEIAYTDPDTPAAGQENPMGIMVSGATKMGAIDAKLLVAVTEDGFVMDNHFHPTEQYGRAYPIARAELGADGDSVLIAASASYKVSDKMTVGATLANTEVDMAGSNDGTIFELDGSLKYKIADNVSYSASVMFCDSDDMGFADDSFSGMVHTLNISF